MNSQVHTVMLAVEPIMVRQALEVLLEAASYNVAAYDAEAFAASGAPSIAIFDAAMGSARVLEMARQFSKRFPGRPWLLLAETGCEPDVVEALEAGMHGYLLKTQLGAEMIAAIRSVLHGGLYLSPVVLRTLIPRLLIAANAPADRITALDRELLRAIAEGKSDRQAADLNGLRTGELLAWRSQMNKRFGIQNTAGLVRYAVRLSIVMA
jgi:DNA-binding NarL/FixJ family response regulator